MIFRYVKIKKGANSCHSSGVELPAMYCVEKDIFHVMDGHGSCFFVPRCDIQNDRLAELSRPKPIELNQEEKKSELKITTLKELIGQDIKSIQF